VGELGDKLEGNLKDAGGKMTGDKKTEVEGKAQKAKGDLEGMGNDLRNNDPGTQEPVESDKNI
jgi:uncharacterized protein YjbJ (UPF0337 family)